MHPPVFKAKSIELVVRGSMKARCSNFFYNPYAFLMPCTAK